jgi:hypothetical protein
MRDFLVTTSADEANRAMVDLAGKEFAFNPDYWPRSREIHGRVDEKTGKAVEDVDLKSWTHDPAATLEHMGFTRGRVANQNPVKLQNALEKFDRHVRQVAAFVGLAKPVRDAYQALDMDVGPEDGLTLRKAITDRYGRSLVDSLVNHLEGQEIAAKGKIKSGPLGKMIRWLTQNVTIGKLMFRWTSALKQLSGVSSFLSDGDARDVAAAATRWLGKEKAFERKLRRWSPSLRNRFESPATNIALQEFGPSNRFVETGLSMLKSADTRNIMVAWALAEIQVKREKPALAGDEFNQAVARRAEDLVSRTQNATRMSDRAGFGVTAAKGDATMNMLLALGSEGLAKVNQFDDLTGRWTSGKIKTPEYVARVMTVAVMAAIVEQGFGMLHRMLKGQDDEEKLKRAAVNGVRATVGNLPFARNAISAAEMVYSSTLAGAKADQAKIDFFEAPLTSTFAQGFAGLADLGAAINLYAEGARFRAGDKLGQQKWKEAMVRALEGINKGLPLVALPDFPAEYPLAWAKNGIPFGIGSGKTEGERALEMMQKKLREHRKSARDTDEDRAISRALAERAFVRAYRAKDQAGRDAAKKAYFKAGGKVQGLRSALKNQARLGMGSKEWAKFEKALSPEERETLRQAQEFVESEK